MKVVLFYHSFVSCWNHGNAHFLRGVARELIRLHHDVVVCEPHDGWSLANAIHDGGGDALPDPSALVPGVVVRRYHQDGTDLDALIGDADLVLVHEWNAPRIIADIGEARLRGGRFLLFFHDTHHRAVTSPGEIERLDLSGYDAVLAFGEVLREIYLAAGWAMRVFTWHEAADTAVFRPIRVREKNLDLIWIGNWGDDERSRELREYLVEPIKALGLAAAVHGVRYPETARVELEAAGIDYRGWLPNHRAAQAFAQARVTVHIPRRPYAETLLGIPTIRVFEALACGIPLVCSPWHDSEALFPPGSYLTARNGEEMKSALARILQDPDAAEELARTGLRAVWSRHTCAHRVDELLRIVATLRQPAPLSAGMERVAAL